MKIIQEGVIPEQRPPWYLEVEIECQNCHCIFKLDEEDVKTLQNTVGLFTVIQARSPNGERLITGRCPKCLAEIRWSSYDLHRRKDTTPRLPHRYDSDRSNPLDWVRANREPSDV